MNPNNTNAADYVNVVPTALALSPDWITAPVTLTNSGNIGALQNATVTMCGNSAAAPAVWTTNTLHYGWFNGGYWYPYYTPVYTQDRKPIRLTMAEVEGLRVAAKKDKALRETLEKFTDHIEVIVDFGKPA